jgi:hypothetical protein
MVYMKLNDGHLVIRLPQADVQAVRAAAERSDRSMSWWLRRAVRMALVIDGERQADEARGES